MNTSTITSNRRLLAIALATMLSSPLALAAQGIGPPEIPRAVSTQAQGTVRTDLPATNAPERTMRELSRTENTVDQLEKTTPPPSPVQSQGAEHAAPPSSVVQRDTWTRLDTDGDGRISTTEGAVDTEFNTSFATMDADRDGFVTDAEFRTAAKASMESGRGGTDASSSASSSLGDVMRRLDANADGSISMSEGDADASIKANFATIDGNSDGTVTSAEYRAWLKATRK